MYCTVAARKSYISVAKSPVRYWSKVHDCQIYLQSIVRGKVQFVQVLGMIIMFCMDIAINMNVYDQ